MRVARDDGATSRALSKLFHGLRAVHHVCIPRFVLIDATIEVLASPSNREVFEADPEVDRVHLADRNWFERRPGRRALGSAVWTLGRSLREHGYDLGIDVHIWPVPVEVFDDPIRFDRDELHRAYDKASVMRFWRIVARTTEVLETFRARTRPEKLTDVVTAFEGGLVVHTGDDIASSEYAKLLGDLPAKPRVEPIGFAHNGFHVDEEQRFQPLPPPAPQATRPSRHERPARHFLPEEHPEKRSFWFESNGRHSREDPDDASTYGRHSMPGRD